MTWRTQMGERTLKGAEAALIRESLSYVVEIVEEEVADHTDSWCFGVPLFDRLEPPAKLALLAEVGWALLRDTEAFPRLTAINEAAVAVLFSGIAESVQIEIDLEDDMPAEPFFWRTRVLAVFHEDGGDTTDLPDAECTDWEEWTLLIECLSDRILWDDDFNSADQFLDAPPETAQLMRNMMSIDDDYYRTIPPDPRDSDLARIRSTLAELCRQ